MKFLSPLFLYLLPLSLIPLILHLMGKRLERKRYFPWIRLLLRTEAEGRKRRRIFELLILLLRMVLITSVLLALARPIRSTVPIPNYVLVDISGSMSQLRERVDAFLDKLRSLEGKLVIHYFADRLLDSPPRISYFATDFSVLNSLNLSGNVLLISDFQRSGLKGSVNYNFKTYLLPLFHRGLNSGVELEAITPFLLKGSPVRIKLRVINRGREKDVRGVKVVDGTSVLFEGEVEVEPHDTVEKTVSVTPIEGKLRAILEGGDEFSGDDTFYLMIPTLEKVRVVLLGANKYIERVLNPAGVKTPFELNVIEKIKAYGDIENAQILIVLKETSGTEREFINRFLKEGGGVLAFYYTPRPLEIRDGEGKTFRFRGGSVKLKKFRFLSRGHLKIGKDVYLMWRERNFVYVGFSPSPLFTDFIYKSEFVPFLLDRMFELLGGGKYLSTTVGGNLVLGLEPGERYKLMKGDTLIAILEGKAGKVKIEGMDSPGFYTLERDDRILYYISVNTPGDEGELDPIEKLESAFRGIKVETGDLGKYNEYAKVFFLVALFSILLEMILLKLREK